MRGVALGLLVALMAACAPVHRDAGTWQRVHVELPASSEQLPPGEGADIANSQCLICHSASMVLTQPKLTEKQWTDTINKMRVAYGAPLPADQVPLLVAYFLRLDAPVH